MQHGKKWVWGGLLLAVAMSGSIAAQTHKALDVKHSFSEQQQAVISDFNGEKYSEISPEDKSKVIDALNRIMNQLGTGNQDINRLPEDVRVSIFNDQNLINTVLTQAAADSRLVCRREKTIGSNMPQNNCLTVAERRRQKNDAQDAVSRMQRTPKKTD